MDLCTGCRNCELACSVRNTRSFTPSRSRIQILKDEPRSIIAPVVCLQCDEPLCRNACPSGAIAENDFGTLTVNQEACIGCMNCVTACVYGGIAMDNKTLKAVKCDLCEGDPACVKACEYGALKLVTADARGIDERYKGIQVLSEALGLVTEEM